MLPQMNGLLVGFGSGNIFRRLNREAPIGAIRRSIRDTMSGRAHGMRASGLEDYFADLMREAHALDTKPGLEAVHGVPNRCACTHRRIRAAISSRGIPPWRSRQSLRALKIEGNLNRFAAVSSWLERNARIGAQPYGRHGDACRSRADRLRPAGESDAYGVETGRPERSARSWSISPQHGWADSQ